MKTLALCSLLALNTAAAQTSGMSAPVGAPEQLLVQTRDGAVFLGDRQLSPRELYAEVGRPDLVERSDSALRRRWIFGIAAAVVVPAALVGAAIARASRPDLNSAYCISNIQVFNEVCTARDKMLNTVSTGLLVGGLAAGALLGTLAYWSSPSVLSRKETRELISAHNHSRLVAPPAEVPGVRVLPLLSKDFFALALLGYF